MIIVIITATSIGNSNGSNIDPARLRRDLCPSAFAFARPPSHAMAPTRAVAYIRTSSLSKFPMFRCLAGRAVCDISAGNFEP